MPWIIDYPIVVEHLRTLQLRSIYYNSGSFAFHNDVPATSLGWMGPADPTIKSEVRHLTRQIPPPHEQHLTSLLLRAWREILPGRIWIMPAGHWAYELDFGSRQWLPAILERIGIDAGMLQGRTTAAAIEFAPNETAALEEFVTRLLEMLQASDFTAAFPHHQVTCLLHHHKQIWWTSADEQVMDAIEKLTVAK